MIDRVAYSDHLFHKDIFPLDVEGEIQVTPHVLFGKYLAIQSLRKDLGKDPTQPDTQETKKETNIVVFERRAA